MVNIRRLFKLVKSMDSGKAKAFIAEHEEGTYTLLDVRQPGEYEEKHLPGAKLIPLPELKDSLQQLDSGKPVIVYWAAGGRSRVAAQLLSGMGFNNVYNLSGGIHAWEGLKAVGPQEMNLEHLRGDETPEEILFLAYGMEKGLQTFYMNMKEKKEDRELRDLFVKLAGIEERHKRMLFELQAEIGSDSKSIEAFEAEAGPAILEGGFDMQELMERNEPLLKTIQNVIELAMMLETQALDLYLRFAEKSTNRKTKKVLLRVGDEEKGHLSALGHLLEEKL